MKKILLENRIYIAIGLIVLFFVLLLFWPQKKETIKDISGENTKIIGIVQRSEGVDWNKTEINIPDSMSVLKSKNSFINGDKLANLLSSLEMSDAIVTQSDSNYVIYKNTGAVLYIKLKEKQIDYQIRSKMKYSGKKDFTIAKNNLSKILGQITNRKTGTLEVEYFKDEFRAIRTDIGSADFMEITTNFLYEGTPIFTYQGGPTVKAQYNFDGKLGRLIISSPFDELESNEKVKLISVDEIQSKHANSFPIFNLKGNREFELSTREDLINMITSESSQIGYIYEPLLDKYNPFLIVKGKTTLKSGIAEVIFGVPIVKKNE